MKKYVLLFFVIVVLLSISMNGVCQDKVINWRLQSMHAAGDYGFQAAKEFANLVNEASGGRMNVTAFTAGAITPAGKEFEGAISGSVEAAHVSSGWAIGYVPAGVFYTSCVGGLTGNQFMMWLDYEGVQMAKELYAPIGVEFVEQLTIHPAEVWAHTNVPLETVDDIKGLKIRMGTTALNSIFENMGASPVFLPGGEIYEAMQRGIIDAFEYITPSLNWGMGFQEVADYMYMSPSRSPSDAQSLFVNKKKWDELPDDLKLIVEMAAHYVSRKFFTEELIMDAEAIEKFKEYGTVIEKIPEEIEELMYEKANEYYAEESAKDPNYEKIYNSTMDFAEMCKEFDIK
jgi:TRAP-type mannitol/chloroaromatic compound transport system substrate-binding protein